MFQYLCGAGTATVLVGCMWMLNAIEPTRRDIIAANEIYDKYRKIVLNSHLRNEQRPEEKGIILGSNNFIVPLKFSFWSISFGDLLDPFDRLRIETALAEKGLRMWTFGDLDNFKVGDNCKVVGVSEPTAVTGCVVFKNTYTGDSEFIVSGVSDAPGSEPEHLSNFLLIGEIDPLHYKLLPESPKTMLVENMIKYYVKRPFMDARQAMMHWSVFVRPFSYRLVR
ncbi:MAG: hypothetical protein JSS82_00255 [Bacteroidetes bacterium]|nr:hypothetical protein [Bacteroidota bacterium]